MLKENYSKVSILFLRIPPLPDSFGSDLPEAEQHDILCKLGILPRPTSPSKARSRSRRVSPVDSDEHSSEEEYPGGSIVSRQRINAKYHSMPERLLYILCDKLGKCLNYLHPAMGYT